MKKFDNSSLIGDAGIALIHTNVNAMGFVWRERTKDTGIDGDIELRDPATGVVGNRFLFVQSKARNAPFQGETAERFYFSCTQADVDYWMQADMPVILVCSHPETGDAWWMHVQGWFGDPSRRASKRIDFDKATQRFDKSAAQRLWNLSDPHGHAHTPVPVARPETLVSNLIQIGLPNALFQAKTTAAKPGEVYAMMCEATGRVRHDWMLRGDRLFTWHDPASTELEAACAGRADPLSVDDWLRGDAQEQRNLVWLLNGALRQDALRDCDWYRDRKIIYFRASPDLSTRKIVGPSGQARLVFHGKQKKKKTPTEVAYYKHVALAWRFILSDEDCFCALSPTYHYTFDGYRESRYAAEHLSGIKRLDRNPAVLGQTRMWAYYLAGEENLLEQPDLILNYGSLETLAAPVSINDNEWLTTEPPNAVIDLTEANEDRLFEVTA